jgi:D-glycero-D-manno-heptose 1,7-bisphosphate phosphatase
MTGAIFLDRDGVINRKPPEGSYVRTWSEFAFEPGTVEALVHLTRHGRGPLIVVTNQRGIARGVTTREAVDEIHRRMQAALAKHGVQLAGIRMCPHDLGTCDCRKPEVGMFLAAVRENPEIELDRSAVVGDSISDLEAARRIGADVFAVSPQPERLVALAAESGIAVSAVARSLLDLVRTGALDAAAPIRTR